MAVQTHPQMISDLKLEGERALFDHKIKGIVALCYQNERPLQGLAGKLDWRFHGLISHFIQKGSITGQEGECVYIPAQKSDQLYHLLLVGGGLNQSPGNREAVSNKVIQSLRENLKKLKIDKIGISCQDFGGMNEKFFIQEFKESPLWIVQ